MDAVDNTGDTALIRAVQTGKSKCVNLLIEAGADVNVCNSFCVNALTSASQDGHVKVVDALIKAGVDVQPVKNESGTIHNSALYLAAESGEHKVVDLLVKAGADVDEKGRWRHTFDDCSMARSH